ncbi:phenylacetate--CoA ligase family protein [Blautia sp.]
MKNKERRNKLMQIGEVLRRVVFNELDAVKGGKLKKLKEVNKREIVEGVTEEYVERRIQALLEYAKDHSPYYRENPQWKELSDFPVLTKGDFIEAYDKILTDNSSEQGNLYRLSTSGSTGTPFTVLCDGDKMNRVNMNFISCMELNGFRMGMKRGEFRAWIKGKNTISKWKSFKNNLIMVDISNMGDESLEKICRDIEKKKIQVLVSYSSALVALSQYLKKTGRDISKWKVEMIFSMGEALPDGTYDLLQEIFGFSPVRSYGNNENGFIAIQLGEEKEYTIDLYNFYTEILKMDSDEPAEPGELGRIVVTDYYNKTFPMIRYDTGDTGKIRLYKDEKGRLHGKFVEIYGRRGSLIYNCQGEPLSIHVFMNILLNFEGIVYQAKCIQREKKEYELLINADREKLQIEEVLAAYRKYLGAEAQIKVTYVEEIPVQSSGKFMVCENLCPDYI